MTDSETVIDGEQRGPSDRLRESRVLALVPDAWGECRGGKTVAHTGAMKARRAERPVIERRSIAAIEDIEALATKAARYDAIETALLNGKLFSALQQLNGKHSSESVGVLVDNFLPTLRELSFEMYCRAIRPVLEDLLRTTHDYARRAGDQHLEPAAHCLQSPWGERADAAFVRPADVRVDDELVYAQYGQRAMHLDLYRPAKPPRHPIPAVVVIPGGAWHHGDGKGFAFIAAALAQAGFAAACIQYRTSQEAPFPAAVQDAKAAVRWLRANAEAYRIDPDAIGAIGGSAGARLAAMLATSDAAADLEGGGGNAGVSSRISAAIAMAPGVDLVDLTPYPKQALMAMEPFLGVPLERHLDARRRALPASYVTGEAAPILLVHSDVDPGPPYGQSLLMRESVPRRWRARGATDDFRRAARPLELSTLVSADHGASDCVSEGRSLLRHVDVAKYRSRLGCEGWRRRRDAHPA